MQDLMNRGYSRERAAKAAEKSFRNGDDIEDAKEALAGNREYFKGQYDKLVKALKSNRSDSNPYWNNTVPGATYPIRRNNQDIYTFIMGLPNG